MTTTNVPFGSSDIPRKGFVSPGEAVPRSRFSQQVKDEQTTTDETVLRGLSMMAGLVEAGGAADTLGIDEDSLDAQGQQDWRAIVRACEWVRQMQACKANEIAKR